ncbi:hypothetical protein [Streptomyces pseudovenezuelae]|uniref:Secreted protein n=1 Tax=Streptomyces pseudovenezuelae TaxID=67350 RepID=A0ABT6LKM0_9ACTN|nr:hypothetical protein [Streptomyces pseudovenezuelae]MDH6216847.1 hypothetical protein [Streptomyces pseudovenezuelae]
MMAVSLGVRISGLLLVGAVAVAVAAVTSDGSGFADSGGGDSTTVSADPSAGGPGDRTRAPCGSGTPVRPSPAGAASATAIPGPTATHLSRTPTPSTSPAPSPPRKVVLQAPAWLPPGPRSPDEDAVADPSGVYDRLTAPDKCRAALGLIPQATDPQWRLLRGLASACLAVQGGRGGSWERAAQDHAALAGRADTCKGRAAYAVLGGLLDFHRRHPAATVRLKASAGAAPACSYGVSGTDTGGDGEALPGEMVGIELSRTYFEHAELLRYGSLFIGGVQVPGPLVMVSGSGDKLVLAAVVPGLDDYPRPVDVVVKYGATEARLADAFTVVSPGALPSVSPDPASRSPQGMFPVRPLPAHRARP